MSDVSAFITNEPLEVSVLAASVRRSDCGAVVVFEGNVRSPNEGVDVERLDYETYERVAGEQIYAVACEVAQEFELVSVLAAHRIGSVPTGETALLVAVSAARRQAAFDGSARLVDRIKAEVAIWKQEISVIRDEPQ